MQPVSPLRLEPASDRLELLRSNLMVLCARLDNDQILALADSLHALIRERSAQSEPARHCAGRA